MVTDKDLDLVISRLLKAPRAAVWRAWSDPSLLTEWWCPKPWRTELLGFRFAPGGAFHARMRGPAGEVSDNPGAFLDIAPMSRIVFTTALLENWRPAPDPWMPITAIVTLADDGEDTAYTATVLHRDQPMRDRHEQLGFFEGWGICLQQLEDVAAALS